MKKNNLTELQANQYQIFVSMLSNAGWNASPQNELFEKGFDFNEVAKMEFSNSSMELYLDLEISEKRISMSIWSKNNTNLLIYIYYKDTNLKKILESIIAYQNKISKKNYKHFLKSIIQICPNEIYVAIDQENSRLAQLVDENGVDSF